MATAEAAPIVSTRTEKSKQWAALGATVPKRFSGRAEMLREVRRCAEVYRREIAEERRLQLERERSRRMYATVERAFAQVEQSLEMLERAQRALSLPAAGEGLSALRRAHAHELAQFAALKPRDRLRRPTVRSADYRLLIALAECWSHHLQTEASGPDWQQFACCALLACGSHSELGESRRHLQAAAEKTSLQGFGTPEASGLEREHPRVKDPVG